jgi:amidase
VLEAEALAAADDADRAVRRGGRLGPLHGVPITTKINTDLAGHPTTNGVVAFKDMKSTADSAVVRNLRDSGAVIIGRTNVPAFSFRWFTDNDLHGRTLNPWNPRLTPGGSSGGAGAAVAVGIGALAQGTDIAGSSRYPGYACGVAGLRTSLGAVAVYNPTSADTPRPITNQLMGVNGLLARRVADLRLGLPVLAARDVRDSWWQPTPPPPKARVRTAAIMTSLNGYTADAGVSSALARAAKALTDAGWEVEEAAPPHFQEAAELWSPLVLTEARFALVPAMHAYGDSKVIRAIDTWTEVTPALDLREFSAALGRREQILRAWRQFFEKYPVLITPPSWRLPFPVDLDQQGPEAFKEILRAQSPMLAVALLGLPGLTVPTGFHSGVPTGVQIVADRFREDLCFDAGEVVEGAHPMPTPTDPRTAPAR